jgi:CrcB protein
VWIGIGLFGGLGAVARYGAELRLGPRWGTHAVNVAGAFLLGLLAGASGDARQVLGVGFLGAFTTFSTWLVIARRHPLVDLGAALILGLAAVWLGDRLA